MFGASLLEGVFEVTESREVVWSHLIQEAAFTVTGILLIRVTSKSQLEARNRNAPDLWL